MKKLATILLTLAMVLELGFNGGTVVHAAKNSVLSKVEIITTYPAGGNKQEKYVNCVVRNKKKNSTRVISENDEVCWYKYSASDDVEFTSITKWNESDWKAMKKNEKFEEGKFYVASMYVTIDFGNDVFSSDKSAYSSNKNSRILDLNISASKKRVDIKVAYKCGKCVNKIFLEYSKDIQIGKTPRQMNGLKVSADIKDAFSSEMTKLMKSLYDMKGNDGASEWLKSVDGKKWDYMKADEKFKYNVKYKYNVSFVLMIGFAISMGTEDYLNMDTVTGFSEDPVLYVNGIDANSKKFDKLFEKIFIRRKAGSGTTVGKLKCKVLSKATKKKVGKIEITGTKNKKIKSVKIPDIVKIKGLKYKVTAIKAGAFRDCKKLKKVTIKAKSLKKIGKKAFYRKKGKKITFKVPKKLKKKYSKLIKKAKTNNYIVK